VNAVDTEFVEIFREEAAGRLDAIVEILLGVERGGASSDAVNALFREAHTLKGAAGMVGLGVVQTLAHEMEDVLSDARAAGSTLPPALVEPLLQAVDAMRAGIAGIDARPLPAEPVVDTGPRVRVPAAKVDRLLDLVGETMLHRRRLTHALGAERSDDPRVTALVAELDVGGPLLDELKDAAIGMRMLPLSSIVGSLRRVAREAARSAGKEIELVLAGADTELDRALLEELPDQLAHVLRNAIDHGIEPPRERERAGKPPCGSIELSAVQHEGVVEITISDDGRGVSAELLARAGDETTLADLLAAPGLSTATAVSDLSGRGVGLDSVKRYLEARRGRLAVSSTPGHGTRVTLALPLTLALLDVLLFRRGANVFGLPVSSVQEALIVERRLTLAGSESIDVRGTAVPLVDVADLIGADAPAHGSKPPAIVVTGGGRRLVVTCDRLLGEEDVVLKPLESPLANVRGYLGTAVLGDGSIALVLDPLELVRGTGRPRRARPGVESTPTVARSKVLVVEDSFTVRELQRSVLEAAGYDVATAENGRLALEHLDRDPDVGLVVTDLEMPELNGLELTAAIRGDSRRASLPVVIVTSLGTDDDRQRGIDAGADAYVVKSAYDQQALLATVGRLIGR
jgi:two-component system, chemotaxis family, sensor kinase CheA